jgi:hypothetical protein
MPRVPWWRRRLEPLLVAVLWCGAGVLYWHAFFACQPDRSASRLRSYSLSAATSAATTIAHNKREAHAASLSERRPSAEHSRLRPTATTATLTATATDKEKATEEAEAATDTTATTTTAFDRADASRSTDLVDWLLVWMLVSALVRLYVAQCVHPRLRRARIQRTQQESRGRTQRFRQWVTRLNRQRESYGQPPLSAESLRLVLSERELNGDDYDGLLQFHDEAGPAVEALRSHGGSMLGASAADINRSCPLHVLSAEHNSALLPHPPPQKQQQQPPGRSAIRHDDGDSGCPICLEPFGVGHVVRTIIPCGHIFHKDCLDPWLQQRATCPVCKYNIQQRLERLDT